MWVKVHIIGNSLILPFMYVVKYQNALFMFRLWIIFLKSKPLPNTRQLCSEGVYLRSFTWYLTWLKKMSHLQRKQYCNILV